MKRLLCALGAVVGVTAGACGADQSDSSNAAGAARPFCTVVADVNELYRTTSSVAIDSSMSKDEVRSRVTSFEESVDASIERGESLFVELQAAAPTTLRADVRLLAEDAVSRARALRDSEGDPLVFLRGLWPPSDNAELRAARDRVDHHTRAACGTPFGPPAEPVTPTAPAPSSNRDAPPPSAPPAPPAPPTPSEGALR